MDQPQEQQTTTDPMDAAVALMEKGLFGAEAEPGAQTPEVAEEQTEATEETQQDETAEYVEIVADDGETFKVPPKLKDSFLRRDDYTKKVTEVAQLRKQAAIQAQAQQAQEQFAKHIEPELRQLNEVQAALSRYQSVQWDNLDADQFSRLRAQREDLREQAKSLQEAINGKHGQFQQWRQQQRAELAKAGHEHLRASIPGWGEQHVKDAASQAKAVGYTDDEVNDVYDPRFVKLAWKAAQYDRLMNTKGAALATAAKAPPVIKPGSSDPAMSAKVQNMNWHKQMKQATDQRTKVQLAEAKMARFFGA